MTATATAAGPDCIAAGPAALAVGGGGSMPGGRSALRRLDCGVHVTPSIRRGKPRNQERQMLTFRREDGAC
jgi:hypothetical protein